MSLQVTSLSSQRKEKAFDLFDSIVSSLKQNKTRLEEGDVLVISSKFISYSQGRLLNQNFIKFTTNGESLAKKFQLGPELAEVIARESDEVFGGISGFVVTSSDNILAPNAGIDKSNAKKNQLILYPVDPFLVSEQIKRKIFLELEKKIGVIIVDSRLMPSRIGTTGVAIACAGIEPVLDNRGKPDLEGNPLKVTFQAVVDNLASIANHKMGEGSELKPMAIIKNSGAKLTSRKITHKEMTIPPEQCVYMRSLTK